MNTIKNLPSHLQILIGVVPSVVLIALFFFLIYSPKHKELDSLNARVIKLDQEIAAGEEKVRKLDDLIAENEVLKKKLAQLKEQLPEEKEVTGLLKQISDLGLRAGLEILLWKPEAKKTQPAGLYIEIPVSVEVLTEYHKLGDFFSHISRLPRLVNISDILLKEKSQKGNEENGIIHAKFTARTFASVSQKDVAAGGNNKGSKGTKGKRK